MDVCVVVSSHGFYLPSVIFIFNQRVSVVSESKCNCAKSQPGFHFMRGGPIFMGEGGGGAVAD